MNTGILVRNWGGWKFIRTVEGPRAERGRSWATKQFMFMETCSVRSFDTVGEILGCRRLLHTWFVQQGVSARSVDLAIQLCGAVFLQAQPHPRSWNRRGKFEVTQHCRYLWYRHAARILGWCNLKPFPDFVTEILRTHVFPTVVNENEAPCSCSTSEKPPGEISPTIHFDIGHSSSTSLGEFEISSRSHSNLQLPAVKVSESILHVPL